MEELITLKDVCYSYHSLNGEIKALQNISFQVEKGEFVGIVGPSGCGKSTLLSLIAELTKPECGEIITSPSHDTDDKIRIGYMLQHDHLFEWRTIYKNVILGLELNKQMTPEKLAGVDQLLKEYGLYDFRFKKPAELSGGMKQRAALIRTMALEPDLLLLDEPFSALDYQTRLMVSADIGRLIRARNKTMLIVTHDISEAISICDKVIILSNRPATVKKIVPIKLTPTDESLLAARKAPEFQDYFNMIWEEMLNEE